MNNLPPAQQNMNSPATANRKPTLRLLGYLTILIGSVIAGLAIAVLLHSFSPTVYESNAKFLISKSSLDSNYELDFSSIIDRRHDLLLPETNIITMCLHKYDLSELSSLRDLPREEAVSFIQKNLTITQHPDEPALYELMYWSENPRDAQTVAATLVSTYEKTLRTQVRYALEDHKEIVAKTYNAATNDYKAAELKSDEKALEQALQRKNHFENQLATLVNVDAGRLFKFETLDPAMRGDPVRPSLPMFLGYGAAGGFVVGMCLILLWALLVNLSR
ncbi:hypothetical protein N9Y42_02820 [Mariniblastus sp.]|nr:hypothetical protein [Mariniblastus sp.]